MICPAAIGSSYARTASFFFFFPLLTKTSRSAESQTLHIRALLRLLNVTDKTFLAPFCHSASTKYFAFICLILSALNPCDICLMVIFYQMCESFSSDDWQAHPLQTMREKAVCSKAERLKALLATAVSNSARWTRAWGTRRLHKQLNDAASRGRKTAEMSKEEVPVVLKMVSSATYSHNSLKTKKEQRP